MELKSNQVWGSGSLKNGTVLTRDRRLAQQAYRRRALFYQVQPKHLFQRVVEKGEPRWVNGYSEILGSILRPSSSPLQPTCFITYRHAVIPCLSPWSPNQRSLMTPMEHPLPPLCPFLVVLFREWPVDVFFSRLGEYASLRRGSSRPAQYFGRTLVPFFLRKEYALFFHQSSKPAELPTRIVDSTSGSEDRLVVLLHSRYG